MPHDEAVVCKKWCAFKAAECARKKVARGLDPTIDNRRATQKPDETDAAFAKRLRRNRRNAELQRLRYHNRKPADWSPKPRPKLTEAELRANATARKAAWRRRRREAAEAMVRSSDDEVAN